MTAIGSTNSNVSNTYANQGANTGTASSTNAQSDQLRADALAQMGQLKSAESIANSKSQASQLIADDARKAMDKGNADIAATQTRVDAARQAMLDQQSKWGMKAPNSVTAQQAYAEITAELQKLKDAQPGLDKAYAEAKTVLAQAKQEASIAKAAVDANQMIINATGPNSGGVSNPTTDTSTDNVSNQAISAFTAKTRDPGFWTTANIRTILVEVLSTASDLSNQKLLALAQELDNNNQQLKSLGQTTANLQKAQVVFGSDDKGNLPVRDGANLGLSGKGTTMSGDILAINTEVKKLFEDPTYTPKTLTATNDTDPSKARTKETEFMNNYLAMVKEGLQSGAIKKSEIVNYAEMGVTKDQLSALGTTIKARQDELSNVNSKLQTNVQQYNNTVQTLTNLLSQFLANFKSLDTTLIGNMR